MPAKNQRTKTDRALVEDSNGVRHEAMVSRTFDEYRNLRHLSVFTACQPQGTSMTITSVRRGSFMDLPHATLGNRWGVDGIIVVAYDVRGAPTCVRCIATPKVFG